MQAAGHLNSLTGRIHTMISFGDKTEQRCKELGNIHGRLLLAQETAVDVQGHNSVQLQLLSEHIFQSSSTSIVRQSSIQAEEQQLKRARKHAD
jgi:hypothetical protein